MGRRDSNCAAALAGVLLYAGCQFDTEPLDIVGVETLVQPSGVPSQQAPNPGQAGMAATGAAGTGPSESAPAAPTTDIVLPVAPSVDAGGGGPAGDAMQDEAAAEPMAPTEHADAADPKPDPPAVDAAIDAAVVDELDAGPPIDPPSTLFASCERHSDCDQGQFCTSYLALGSASPLVGYCTTACEASADGGFAYLCPQPGSGSVRARCQLATQWCLLEDCQDAECPAGLTCTEVETSIGGGQTVSTYSCQPSR